MRGTVRQQPEVVLEWVKQRLLENHTFFKTDFSDMETQLEMIDRTTVYGQTVTLGLEQRRLADWMITVRLQTILEGLEEMAGVEEAERTEFGALPRLPRINDPGGLDLRELFTANGEEDGNGRIFDS